MGSWMDEYGSEEGFEREYSGGGFGKGVEGRSVLSDAEVLASEIIGNKKLLAIFVRLGSKPRSAKELVNVSVFEVVKKRDRYGGYSEEVVAVRLPQTTMYRLLKRLVDVGLVEVRRGIDYRKKYYRLTDLGREVLGKVKGLIKQAMRDLYVSPSSLGISSKYKAVSVGRFKDFVKNQLGLDPSDVALILGASKFEKGYSEYYVFQ